MHVVAVDLEVRLDVFRQTAVVLLKAEELAGGGLRLLGLEGVQPPERRDRILEQLRARGDELFCLLELRRVH